MWNSERHRPKIVVLGLAAAAALVSFAAPASGGVRDPGRAANRVCRVRAGGVHPGIPRDAADTTPESNVERYDS